MKTWFDIKAKAGDDKHDAEVSIYDEVGGWGISAKDFIRQVKDTKAKRPLVRINSPGGSVFDGFAIFNFLSGLETTVQIDGVAASIASIIALAGKEVRIAENGFMMVHNPSGYVSGDADRLRDYADLLEKLEGTLANAYARKTGKTLEEVKEWMKDETWFTAAEAKAAGLVDTVTGEVSFSASLRAFKSAPAALTQQTTAKTMKKLTEALAAAGLIASADLDDNAAAAQFVTNLKAITDERDALKAKLKTSEDAAKAKAKETAVALVDAAVADGRIVAEHKDAWIAKLAEDAGNATLLASIAKPRATAATPMPASTGTPSASAGNKTLTEQCIEARKAAEAVR